MKLKFDDEKTGDKGGSSAQKSKGLTGFLIRIGLARSARSANILLIVVSLASLLLAAFFFYLMLITSSRTEMNYKEYQTIDQSLFSRPLKIPNK